VAHSVRPRPNSVAIFFLAQPQPGLVRPALALVMLVLASGCTRLDELPVTVSQPPCAKLALSVDPPIARNNDSVNVTLVMSNCGETTIQVPPSGLCWSGLRIQLDGPSGSYDLDDSRAAPYETAFWGVSHGACMTYVLPDSSAQVPVRFSLAPGANHTDVHQLNGTLIRRAWCPAGFEGVTFCDDPTPILPGTYALSVSFTPVNGTVIGAEATANASLVISGPILPRATTRLFYVEERDWLNGTSTEQLPGDFGPHCAPAALVNGTLVLRTYGDGPPPATDEWAVVRDFGSAFHEHSVSVSADHVAYRALGPDGGWFASPWNATASVLQVTPLLDGRAYVNGTLLSVGDETTVRSEMDVGPYHETSVLLVRSLGEVPVRVEEMEPCF